VNLYHIYIGTKYMGPQRGTSPQHAVRLFASKNGLSSVILHAKTTASVQDLKKAA
jgi:hypothetical protein